ncbi:hypothetical protein [Pimelobacter sp. 30-1]|uniref:hypothetical protein n=1 Tax=Pimelobacter sp. 30-1 TaxID=2004991 RepID=UPI001C04F7E1|nr:hypothetical protein [Pimelobacter sp. 30-1]MBU2693846.1 hypothetical protein [Pimelobacter sp. 30-1]
MAGPGVPRWSSVDGDGADLLSLVADPAHPSTEFEWRAFVGVLAATASLHGGRLDQNDYREQLRGVVAPRRIGAFVHRAKAADLIAETDEWSVSTDTQGRNAGRPMRVYRWRGASG